jgi:hypothetical protein
VKGQIEKMEPERLRKIPPTFAQILKAFDERENASLDDDAGECKHEYQVGVLIDGQETGITRCKICPAEWPESRYETTN